MFNYLMNDGVLNLGAVVVTYLVSIVINILLVAMFRGFVDDDTGFSPAFVVAILLGPLMVPLAFLSGAFALIVWIVKVALFGTHNRNGFW